jgi:hypothetical protein
MKTLIFLLLPSKFYTLFFFKLRFFLLVFRSQVLSLKSEYTHYELINEKSELANWARYSHTSFSVVPDGVQIAGIPSKDLYMAKKAVIVRDISPFSNENKVLIVSVKARFIDCEDVCNFELGLLGSKSNLSSSIDRFINIGTNVFRSYDANSSRQLRTFPHWLFNGHVPAKTQFNATGLKHEGPSTLKLVLKPDNTLTLLHDYGLWSSSLNSTLTVADALKISPGKISSEAEFLRLVDGLPQHYQSYTNKNIGKIVLTLTSVHGRVVIQNLSLTTSY